MADNYEKLVQNVQKGEIYTIKLKNDPQIYAAIPMIPPRFQNNNPQKFVLKILAPKEQNGVHELLLEEIEMLEKKSY